MPRTSRRSFLSLTAGALLIAGTKSSGDFRGANDTVRVAVTGINGRGGSHINEFAKMPLVQVAYLVDVDSRLFASKLKTVEKEGKNTPKTTQDIRRALEDKDVDVVSIATPNHWHSLMTIWACQAGKDVYVEKPLSHNIHEGRIAVETARKYNRIVQHGTQSRSGGGNAKVAAAIASGKLGKLLVSRGLCYKPGSPGSENTRTDIGFKEPRQPPATLDYNMWLGPAKEQPYHENIVHYRWHWFWDFGNGDIGNQGVHEMDLARWAIPGGTHPKSCISFGGRFGKKDQAEVPNTQVAILDYGDTQLIFEVRGFNSQKYMGQGVGNVYHLESGVIRGTQYFPKGSDKSAPLPDVELPRRPGGGNFGNFIAAVRSRDVKDLNADVLEAHLSCIPIHLANASYRLGEEVPFNQRASALGDNKEAADALERMAEHLKDEAKLPIDGANYVMGKKLSFNAKTERTGDEKADAILRGTYRKGFEVPETVA